MKQPATLMIFDSMEYGLAWDLQRRLVEERACDRCPDTLILLEHNPVFTIGRTGHAMHGPGAGDAASYRDLPVYRIERGGSVTYHGPGQIVGYPVLHLRSFCTGPKTYMRMLEEVIIRVLAEWGIKGRRVEKLTGVWVGEDVAEKIAAMGVRITSGVTMHGFALNVDPDLAPFRSIVPCGIAGCRVTSMANVLGRPVDVASVRSQIADAFADVFGLAWVRRDRGQADERALALSRPGIGSVRGVLGNDREPVGRAFVEEACPEACRQGGIL